MISVEATGRFAERLRALKLDPAAVLAVMHATAAAWGNPHQHSGLGLRRLRENVFEVRSGLGVRLVFRAEKSALVFVEAGSHDDVRRFIRQR